MADETYQGTIKSYNPGSGYGFVECPETFSQYHGDVFLHKTEFVNSGAAVGQEVSFQISLSEKGQPRAQNMIPIGDAPEGALTGQEAADMPMKSKGKGKGKGWMGGFGGFGGKGMGGGGMGMGAMTGQYVGCITTFNQDKGFGFIECPEIGTDVFVHYSDALNFRVGDMITFELQEQDHIDRGKGKHRACNLNLYGGNPMMDMMMMMGGPMGGMDPMMGGGMGGGPMMGGGGKGFGGGKPCPPWKEFTGEVKSIHPVKRYAFVGSEQCMKLFGKDIYLSPYDVEQYNVQEGEEVLFKVEIKLDGKPQAKMIGKPGEMAAAGNAKLQEIGEGPFNGQVKSYNEGKGFGFIDCEATYGPFQQDIFLHKKEMANIQQQGGNVGSLVEFKLTLNHKGQPQASEITVTDPGTSAEYEPAAKRVQEDEGAAAEAAE